MTIICHISPTMLIIVRLTGGPINECRLVYGGKQYGQYGIILGEEKACIRKISKIRPYLLVHHVIPTGFEPFCEQILPNFIFMPGCKGFHRIKFLREISMYRKEKGKFSIVNLKAANGINNGLNEHGCCESILKKNLTELRVYLLKHYKQKDIILRTS
uniref:Uncharacterized protein n=1 Tax=Rhizophagus irregularis (strain DAOM 181602 / DAOM 197198 / MUCL 43194) TaxID=747089 RepID=U9U4X7_RHIID